MTLSDFMQQLQEQDNVIYSEVPESSIRVIPPEKTCTRIIPPESMVPAKQNTTIRLKINKIPLDIPNTIESVSQPHVLDPSRPIISANQTVSQPTMQTNESQIDVTYTNTVEQTYNNIDVIEKPIQQPTQYQQINTSNNVINEDELFLRSGTELSKKLIWVDYYAKATASRKSNSVVDRMKVGRFTITPDNKVLLLPDYDIVGKDPDMVLKDKWF